MDILPHRPSTTLVGGVLVALVACADMDQVSLAEHHSRAGSSGQTATHDNVASAGSSGAGTGGHPGGTAGAPTAGGPAAGSPAAGAPTAGASSAAGTGDPCGPVNTQPVVIADQQDGPRYLATDDAFLYWAQTKNTSQTVWRAPKDGSGSPVLLASNVSPTGIVVDDSHVFWVTYTDQSYYDGGGSLVRTPKAGGPSEVITSNHARPEDLVRDGEEIFWIASGTLANKYTDGRILRWSEGMSEPQVLVKDHEAVQHLAVAGDFVFWVDNIAAVGGDDRPSVLYRIDRHGGQPEELATSTTAVSLTADQQALYWTNDDGVWRVPHAGSSSELLSDQAPWSLQAQVSGECLYFNSHSLGVTRLAKHGGKLSQVTGPANFTRITVDAQGVYGSSYCDNATKGQVVRFALP